MSSPPMRAGPSGATLRRRAVIEDSDDETDAVSLQPTRAATAKRARLTTDPGYTSMDDEEENRRMGEQCGKASAESLATENAELKAEVERLREKLEDTTEQRDNWRNAADDHRQAFRQEHGARVKLVQECGKFGQDLEEQNSVIDLLNAKLVQEYDKNRELERKLRDPTAVTGIAGICKCQLSTAIQFEYVGRRPYGCQLYDVLNVRGKYDDGDAWWQQGGPGAWAVAYHGTTLESAQQIVRNGFHMSKAQRAAYGHGIYCTPDPATARKYAPPFTHEGTKYRAVLQCFVDPKDKQLGKPANDVQHRDGEYWVMPGGYAIRPYAVCLFAEP